MKEVIIALYSALIRLYLEYVVQRALPTPPSPTQETSILVHDLDWKECRGSHQSGQALGGEAPGPGLVQAREGVSWGLSSSL